MIVNIIEKSGFRGVMLTIKVIRKSRIYDTFSYFGYETQVGDGTVLVQSGFLVEWRYGCSFKNGVELTRAKRLIIYVCDSRDKNRSTFLEKPDRSWIRIRLFVRTELRLVRSHVARRCEERLLDMRKNLHC